MDRRRPCPHRRHPHRRPARASAPAAHSCPAPRIGAGAQVEPGSAVLGKVKAGQLVAGSPAERRGKAKHSLAGHPSGAPADRPAMVRRLRRGLGRAGADPLSLRRRGGLRDLRASSRAATRCPPPLPGLRCRYRLAALAWFLTNLLLILATTRLLGVGLAEGYYRVRSRIGWQVWATERVLDLARDLLFPVYASLFTPVWLRLLGAKVGKNVEASTVLLIPQDDHRGRRRVPGRRHHGGFLRTRRRLDADRPGQDRQTLLPGQLGHDRGRAQRAQELARGSPLRDPGQGEGRDIVAGQPARAAAAHRHRLR